MRFLLSFILATLALTALLAGGMYVLRRVFGRSGGGGGGTGPLGGGRYLCDNCRYDYGDACRRPEKPNATKCPEYQKR